MILKIIYTLFATLFTFFLTALGSGIVFFFKKINNTILSSCYSTSAGIMFAASIFSLLNPALATKSYLLIILGLLSGTLFIVITEHFFNDQNNLMILAITLHNIPEGLAIGIAYGLLPISTATTLALAIGIQNFPEGAAISLPLRKSGFNRFKAFLIGSLSAIVEPIFGIIGILLAIKLQFLMPLFLSFAAGAMIYVIIKELIPESQKNSHKTLMTITFIIGFIIMMLLDSIF